MRKCAKIFGIALLTLISLFSLIIAIGPLLLRTSYGNQLALSLINRDLPGHLTIDTIDLSWFHDQELTKVHYQNREGTLSFYVESVQAKASLPKWIFLDKRSIKEIILQGIEAEISEEEDPSKKLFLKEGKLQASIEREMVELKGEGRLIGKDPFFVEGYIPLRMHEKNMQKMVFSLKNLPSAFLDGFFSITQGKESKLAREIFGEQVNISLKKQDALHEVEIKSQNLKGSQVFKIEDGAILSAGKSAFSCELTREMMNSLFSLGEQKPFFTLEEKALASLEIRAFYFKPEGPFRDISSDAAFNIYDAKIRIDAEDLVKISSLHTEFKLHEGSLKTELSLIGKEEHSSEEMTIFSTAHFNNILPNKENWDVESLQLDLTASRFPLVMLSSLKIPDWRDFLGKNADIQCSLTYSKEESHYVLSYLSPTLHLENIHASISDKIILERPASIHLNLPLEVLKDLSIALPFTLDGQNLIVDGVLESFSTPGPLSLKEDILKCLGVSAFKGNISFSGPLTIHKGKSEALFNSLKIDLETKSEGLSFEVYSELKPVLEDPYYALFHEDFQILMKGKVSFDEHYHWALKDTLVRGTSTHHHFTALFNFDGRTFALNLPASLKMKVIPSSLNGLSFLKNGSFNLKKPLQIDISLTPFTLKEIQHLTLSGHIKMDMLNFYSYGNEYIFKDLFIPFEFFSEETRVTLSPTFKTFMPKIHKEGVVAGKITLKNWDALLTQDYQKVGLKSHLQFMDFPLEIVDTLSSFPLSSLFGKAISLDLEAQYEKNLRIQGSIQGRDLQGTLSLTTNEDLTPLPEKSHAEIHFLLDQERLNALAALTKEGNTEAHFKLLEKSPVTIKLSSIELPPILNKKTLFSATQFALQVHVDTLILNDLKRKHPVHLKNIDASLNKMPRNLSLIMEALVGNENSLEPFFAKVLGENVINGEGNFDYKGAHIEAKASCHSFPMTTFTDLFSSDTELSHKVEALVGNALDAKVDMHMQKMTGGLVAHIQGENGRMKVQGTFDQGLFFLNEPFVAEVTVTPLLGKRVLKVFLPLFQSLESSNSPLRITVQNEGFSFPIMHPNIASMIIKEASLETGKMVFNNSSEISSLLTLLNGEQKEKQILWTTPLFFSMKEGKLKLKRADMLVSGLYHFASWGIVDLESERIDMIVAVAGDTISKALGIEGIKSDSMLQIPFKGPLFNPKLDKTKAAAKISSLVASKQGTEGLILGTFLDIASGSFLEQEAPPPTTKPLPWGDLAGASSQSFQENESHTEKSTFPLEEIEKGTKKLIKKLFQ